jgi:hypothetical protein
MLPQLPLEVEGLNDMAKEAAAFTEAMADFLLQGLGCSEEPVQKRIKEPIDFLNGHGHRLTPDSFVEQT